MKWLELLIGVMIGLAGFVWRESVRIEDHDYRLGKVETVQEKHLEKHEAQYERIDNRLDEIQERIAGLSRQSNSHVSIADKQK